MKTQKSNTEETKEIIFIFLTYLYVILILLLIFGTTCYYIGKRQAYLEGNYEDIDKLIEDIKINDKDSIILLSNKYNMSISNGRGLIFYNDEACRKIHLFQWEKSEIKTTPSIRFVKTEAEGIDFSKGFYDKEIGLRGYIREPYTNPIDEGSKRIIFEWENNQ